MKEKTPTRELYVPDFILETEKAQALQLEKQRIANQAYLEGCYNGWLQSIGEKAEEWKFSKDKKKLIKISAKSSF